MRRLVIVMKTSVFRLSNSKTEPRKIFYTHSPVLCTLAKYWHLIGCKPFQYADAPSPSSPIYLQVMHHLASYNNALLSKNCLRTCT